MKRLIIAALLFPTVALAQPSSFQGVPDKATGAVVSAGDVVTVIGGVTPGGVVQALGSTGTKCITVTPTVEAAAYAAGDCLHATAIEIAGAARSGVGSGKITSVLVTNKQGDTNSKNMTAVFFNSAPSGICRAGINTEFDPADADLLLLTGGGPVTINAHDAFYDNGISYAQNLYLPYTAAATSLYLALVAEEAVTPAVGDYTVTVCVEQD